MGRRDGALSVNPINGATAKVTADQNEKTLKNLGKTKPRFEFICDEVIGNNHFVKIQFTFLPGDPKTAEFALVLRSGKGAKFTDFANIKKKNRSRERNFAFSVKKGTQSP